MTTAYTLNLPVFRLTLKDYIEYSLAFLPRHYRRPASWLMFTPVPAILAVMGAFKLDPDQLLSQLPLLALLVLAAFFAMALLIITICLICSLLNFRNMPNAKYDAHIQINDDHLSACLNHQEGRFKWISINEIVTTRHLILVYVSPVSAVIIPKRLFATSAEQNSFIQQIQQLWHQNRPD
ncbi:MAG: YcxB family protein [Asticcacaulis sp.]